jgi:predicted nucleic acid-binding protein
MYLDTDIILALIKKDDWLKKYINFLKIDSPKTSSISIIEARLVLLRESSRIDAISVYSKIKKLNIEIIPIDEKTIQKSQELLEKYSSLGIFDSIHAASSIVNNEFLLSSDNIFNEIREIKHINPRY